MLSSSSAKMFRTLAQPARDVGGRMLLSAWVEVNPCKTSSHTLNYLLLVK
jgi:hypothetical protein